MNPMPSVWWTIFGIACTSLGIACTSNKGSAPASLNVGAALAAPTSIEARLGEEFSLQPGGTAHIVGESLSVHFERVVSDSRCPVDATCVWEGDAVVRVQLQGTIGQDTTADLHTNSSFATEATFQGYRVRLLRLTPARHEGSEIPPARYAAALIVLPA